MNDNNTNTATRYIHRIEIGQRIEVLDVTGNWVECEIVAYSKAGSLQNVLIEATQRPIPQLTTIA
jgi:16S rRNA U1498 N3-methylase RsmE